MKPRYALIGIFLFTLSQGYITQVDIFNNDPENIGAIVSYQYQLSKRIITQEKHLTSGEWTYFKECLSKKGVPLCIIRIVFQKNGKQKGIEPRHDVFNKCYYSVKMNGDDISIIDLYNIPAGENPFPWC